MRGPGQFVRGTIAGQQALDSATPTDPRRPFPPPDHARLLLLKRRPGNSNPGSGASESRPGGRDPVLWGPRGGSRLPPMHLASREDARRLRWPGIGLIWPLLGAAVLLYAAHEDLGLGGSGTDT